MPLVHRLANTGTLQTSTYFTEFDSVFNSEASGSLNFSESGDLITFASDAAFALPSGTAFTFEAWIYPNSWNADGTSGPTIALVPVSSGFQIGRAGDGSPGWGIAANGIAWDLLSTTYPTVGVWNHIVVVRNGSNVISLFLNGTRLATATVARSYAQGSLLISRINGTGGPGGLNDYFHGNISNLRLVKGTAVYDPTLTTLTVPTSQLTNITNTVLLLNTTLSNPFVDSSNNNFSSTLSGSVLTSELTPFSSITGSLKFNGSTDYISVPNTNIGPLSGREFTIEAFIYLTNYSAGYVGQYYSDIFSTQNGSGAALELAVAGTASSYTGIRIYANSGGTVNSTFLSTILLNTWYHVALTRTSAGVFTVYLNGTSIGTVTNTGSWTDGNPYNIARSNFTPYTFYFPGLISNFRLNIGTPLYSGNFTPSTNPLTNVTGTKLLLNTTLLDPFKDSSSNNNTITVGSGAVSNTSSPFGGSTSSQTTTFITTQRVKFTANNIIGQLDEVSSLLGSLQFTGSNYLNLAANANLQIAGAPFTIEAWVYPTSRAGGEKMISAQDTGTSNGAQYQFRITTSGQLQYIYWTTSSRGSATTVTTSNTVPLNQWSHVAVCYDGTTLRLFVNGTSGYSGAATMYSNAFATGIGGYSDPPAGDFANYAFIGNISNFRILKGTALYTANFVVPTSSLTAVTNTALLLNTNIKNPFVDSSTNNFSFTNNGAVISSTLAPSILQTITTSAPKFIISNTGIMAINGSGQFDEYTYFSNNPLLTLANFRISAADSLSATANGTSITSIPNLGIDSYTITSSTNSPKKILYNGYPVIAFNSIDAFCLDISSELNLSTSGTLFFVGRNNGSRMIALGGSLGSSSGSCFFGFSSPTNATFLFRNTSDVGLSVSSLPDYGGLEVIAIVKNGTSVNLYVNSLSYSTYNTATGTFKFGKIGARDYSNILNSQKSDGYIGDVVYYNSILSNDEIGSIITELKSKYGIA